MASGIGRRAMLAREFEVLAREIDMLAREIRHARKGI